MTKVTVYERHEKTGELEPFEAETLDSNPSLCRAVIGGIPFIYATPGTYAKGKQPTQKISTIPKTRIAKTTEKAVLAEFRDGSQQWLPLSTLTDKSIRNHGDFGDLVVETWALER